MPLKKFKMFFNRLVSKVGSRQFVKNQHTRIAAATCKLPIVWYVLDKVCEDITNSKLYDKLPV